MTGSAVEKGQLAATPAAYGPGVDLLVLGPVEVRNFGEPVPIGGPKQRAILAVLTAEVGHPVSLDRIVDDVYGEEASEGARRSVRTFISMIRRELGDAVQKQGAGYALMVDPSAIDAFRFEEEVRTALPMVQTDPELAATTLRDALAMWRGHPYADIESRGRLQPEITRLTDLRLSSLEARIDADLALGRHRELTGELEALIVEHPLRERFRSQLMLALYRSARQTEALRAYERARLYLADEIGIAPSSELSLLEQQILEQDPALDLPAAASVTQRAVLVVDVAGSDLLTRGGPSERESLTRAMGLVDAAMTRHHAESATQRGSAIYASFLSVEAAVATVDEVIVAAMEGVLPRASIDFGDIELHESGDIGGPPVRRSAGMVAVSHPGQVLLSAEANHALISGGQGGLVVRSLGTFQINGVESPQQIFQLVLAGHDGEFPELLLDANPPPMPFDRKAVPGYELRQPLVSDLVGTTYRAYQPSAGREVELTVIDAAWAAEPEFVSRFEVETQLISRLLHPHILPLLDYWRDPSGAYLVSLSAGGGTLAERLGASDFSLEEVRRLVTQVGEALAHAHEMGIVHGSISPRAVVVDESGNGYLPASGFVLRLVATESLDEASKTSTEDVDGLGRLAEELLAGPGPGEHLGVEELRAVVERATAQREADRFPSIGEFLAAWNEGSGREESRSGPVPLRNPYKGLAAFQEADSDDFFGRSGSVAELIDMLGEQKLVAVVGPSGSGKSSLVHAGLVPAVRDGALAAPGPWLVASMFPGSYPLEELESALSRVAVEDPGALIDELGSDTRGLTRVIKRILPPGTSLLLVIDQFEELFTLTREEEARDRLLQGLVDLVRDERSETRVVLTLRADFFDRPLQYPAFGELIKAGTLALTTPGPDHLMEAIELPAKEVGATWEISLPETIRDDVAGSPGMLPLLQYALTELFAERKGRELTHAAYRANGGVLGALSRRADGVYDWLDEAGRDLARQIFLRLVTVEPTGEVTRHRARLPELNALGDPDAVKKVLDAFGGARLLVFDRDPISRSPTVEVAHEALLSRWPRLAGWIGEAEEDLLLHRRLQDAVDEWEGRDRKDEYLLAGGRLAQFETWAGSTDLALGALETEYLQASGDVAERQRSRRRRIRNMVTAGFGVAALVAGLFASSAARNSEIAHSRELGASAINVLDDDPELSVLLALEAAGTANPPIESVSALHRSLAAHHKILTYQMPTGSGYGTISPDGDLLAVSSGPNIEVVEVASGDPLWSREFGEGAALGSAFSADGSVLVATVGWDGSDDSPIDPQLNGEFGVHSIDARTGALLDHLPMGPCELLSPEMVIGPGAGSQLLTGVSGSDCNYDRDRFGRLHGSMSFLDLATGDMEVLSKGSSEGSATVHSTPDGRRVAIYDQDSDQESVTRVVERPSGREVAVLPGSPFGISEDGTVVLTDSLDGIATWDVSAGQPEEPLMTRPFSVGSWLSPDGTTVANRNGPVVDLIDSRTGEVEQVLRTGLGSNDDVSFSDDGFRVVVNGDDRTVVIDRRPRGELGADVKLCDQISIQSGYVDVAGGTASVFAACGTYFTDQYVLDSETLARQVVVADQGGRRSALSPNGEVVATQSGRVVPGDDEELFLIGPIVLRDTATGKVIQTLDGLCEWIEGEEWGSDSDWGKSCVQFPDTPFPNWPWDLAFSHDGSMLAMSGQYTPAVVVWDTGTGEIIGTPSVPHITDPEWVWNAAFSPTGDRLAAKLGPELWMFSTEDWREIGRFQPPEQGGVPVDNLVFTPDGETLLGTSLGHFGAGDIIFLDGRSLENLGRITGAHVGGINDLALNEQGSLLASAGVDGVVRVWDMATRSLVHEIPLSPLGDGVGGVGFVGDSGHLLATALATGEVRKVTFDTEELLDIARSRVTRGFTETECNTYRIDPCPTLEEIRAG